MRTIVPLLSLVISILGYPPLFAEVTCDGSSSYEEIISGNCKSLTCGTRSNPACPSVDWKPSLTENRPLFVASDLSLEKMTAKLDKCCNGRGAGENQAACGGVVVGPADAPPGAGTSVLAKHGQASSKAEAERALNRAGACRAAKVSCDKSVAAAKASLIARCSECSTNSDGSLSLLQQLNAVGDICKSSSYSEQADVTMAQQNYVASEEYGRAADSSGSNPDTGGKTPGGAPGTGSKSPGGAPGTGSKAPSDSTAKTPSSKSGDGGIGQIAQAAMPLLTAMMNQQNQPTPPPVAPPTIPSVQCGGAMVSGQCPPTAVAASDAWKMPAGTYGLQPSSASKGSFNTADNKNPNTSPDVPTVEPSKTASSANVVPNGGGQMPGQGGSGGGATLGGNGAAGAGAQGIMGKVADVLHGLSGGSSLSAQAQAMNTSTGGSGGWSGYEKGGSGAEAPVDWSQWLPGGKNAARQLAGGNARIVQIQSKEVNIWSRISDHIRARCNQGLLRDCIP